VWKGGGGGGGGAKKLGNKIVGFFIFWEGGNK
jgi:hypothetical protein